MNIGGVLYLKHTAFFLLHSNHNASFSVNVNNRVKC